jgi:hypothetical protein
MNALAVKCQVSRNAHGAMAAGRRRGTLLPKIKAKVLVRNMNRGLTCAVENTGCVLSLDCVVNRVACESIQTVAEDA